MIFMISLVFSILFILLFDKALRAHPAPFYVVAAAVAFTAAAVTWSGAALPEGFAEYIWPVFARGGLAGALFVIVMFTGAFPNGSAPMKRLMPIRGQLSIIASILTLGHNAAYGRLYFVRLFTAPASLPPSQLLAAVCSVLMLAIMLPLFVTSFQSVRKKMKPKAWKGLQRWAYAFYALLYCHILLLTVPGAVRGDRAYQATVFVYGTVFLSYLFCRVGKALARRSRYPHPLAKGQALSVLCCAALWGAAIYYMRAGRVESAPPADQPIKGYQDGVYTGSAMGMNADIEVRVTIENGEIVDIAIESSRDDEPYFSDALCVIDDILAAGSTHVDTVTGATYSSGGIIDAVEAALAKAGV